MAKDAVYAKHTAQWVGGCELWIISAENSTCWLNMTLLEEYEEEGGSVSHMVHQEAN